jgi:hypothetical protein
MLTTAFMFRSSRFLLRPLLLKMSLIPTVLPQCGAPTYSVMPALEDPLEVPLVVPVVPVSGSLPVDEAEELDEPEVVSAVVPVVGASVVSGAPVVAVVMVVGPALAPLPRPQPPKSASTSLPSRWQQPSASQV